MTDAVVCGGVPGKPQKIVCIKSFFLQNTKNEFFTKTRFSAEKKLDGSPQPLFTFYFDKKQCLLN
jgi:hypothetical protein